MRNFHRAARKTMRNMIITVLAIVVGLASGGAAYAASSTLAAGVKDPERVGFYQAFKGKTVVYVPLFMHLDLTEGWYQGLKLQSEATGYKLILRNANFKTSNGTRILSQMVHAKDKPDIVVVQNPDITSYARLEEQLQKAGVFVIQLNMKSLATTTGFVGGDATRIGEVQARALVKHCGAGTNTSHQALVLIGPPTAPWTAYMEVGYHKVLSKHPEIKIVSTQSTGNWDAATAKNITATVLQQYPKLCGIMGPWDNTDIGTAAAVKAAHKADQVFLTTSGGGGQIACKLISSDKADQYVSYNVPGQAHDVQDLVAIIFQAQAQGMTTKTMPHMALYSPLRVFTKESIKVHPCWSTKTMRYGIVDMEGLPVTK